MSSSRLPGKVLADIHGKPCLARLVDRLRACRTLDDIVVATTDGAADDAIAAWCDDYGVACFRGSEEDVLGRVVGAQAMMNSELIVEITGDDPLTDPEVVDLGVETFLANDADVVTNCGAVKTWPIGVYVQVFPYAALAEVAATVDDPAVREHVSLYFYENPARYRVINVLAPAPWRVPDHRFNLDYPEDLEFQNAVYARLEPELGGTFGVGAVMDLVGREPALLEINRDCVERKPRP